MGDKELTNVLTKMAEQQRLMAEDNRKRDEQMAKILQSLVPAAGAAAAATPPTVVTGALPSFQQFDVTSEMWPDYWCRFRTFFEANSVPEGKQPHVFLTNQSTLVYKMLANLSAQQTPPKPINSLTMKEIEDFMADQFHPKKFVVRERYKFWSKMDRKPGESIPELAARLRADAATCDFASIKDPQDEALRTRFSCSVNNEAVLKAFFRVRDDELTFAKAVEIAQELEDASAVAKETIYGQSKSSPVFRVGWDEEEPAYVNKVGRRQTSLPPKQQGQRKPTSCDRCGRTDHSRDNCRMMDATCFHCQRKGHISAMCRARQRGSPPQPPPIRDQHPVRLIRTVKEVSPVGRVGRIRRVSLTEEIATPTPDADGRTPPSVTARHKTRNLANATSGRAPLAEGQAGRNEPSPPRSMDTVGRRRRQPSLPSSKRNVTCYRCRRKGHIASRCRSRQMGGSPPQTPPIKGQHHVRRIRPVIEEEAFQVGLNRSILPKEFASKPDGNAASPSSRPTNRKQWRRPPTDVSDGSGHRGRTEPTCPDGGGASQEGRPNGAVSDWKENHQPCDYRSTGERRDVETRSTSESHRREAKRRKKSRNRQRRRAKKKEARQETDDITCYDRGDRDFVGEESRDAATEETLASSEGATEESPATVMSRENSPDVQAGGETGSSTAAADDVDPRRRGEHAAAASERIGVVGSAIAAGDRQYDRGETADVGKESVSKDDGDNSSPTQMQERQQCDRGTDDGDGSYKGKFTFPSVHYDVRPPPDRISSVSTFRVAHGDEDEQQPSDGVADGGLGPSSKTCDASAPTEVFVKPRHHMDRRNWTWFDDDAILRGPARARRRRELESAEPPDISTLFG